MNSWTEISEIWHGRYAIGHYYKLVISNFLHAVIPLWRMLEVVRWNNDETITYDNLHMHITVGIHIVDIKRTLLLYLSADYCPWHY
jgi:hypothetical protein